MDIILELLPLSTVYEHAMNANVSMTNHPPGKLQRFRNLSELDGLDPFRKPIGSMCRHALNRRPSRDPQKTCRFLSQQL